MKKHWIALITLLAVLLLAGCQQKTAIPADSLQDTETAPVSSFSGSKTETTKSESESSEKTEQSEASITEEPSIAEASATEKESSESNSTPTESKSTVTPPEKEDDTKTEPSLTEDTSGQAETTEQTTQPEPEIQADEPSGIDTESTVPEPETPKSIYDYEFDVEAIRQELLAIGTEMGLENDSSLTPDSSSWGNPVTASESFQGSALERRLKDYVRSMPDLITAYGGTIIQYFTIYVEPLGGGSYRFYFLY